MTERIGNDTYTDTAPTSTSTYVGKGYFGTNTDTSCGVGNYADDEVNSIYPLTTDKDTLKRRIDKLATGRLDGRPTRHGLGLVSAVAQVELCPGQAFPSAKPAGAYSDLTTKNAKGIPSCARSPC